MAFPGKIGDGSLDVSGIRAVTAKIVFLVFLLTASSVPAQDDSDEGSWERMASTPSSLDECAGALVGDSIYVGGGGTRSGGRKSLFIFVPATKAWEQAPDMPVGMHHLHMAGFNGDLYVLGGSANARKSPVPWLGTTHAFALNPATGQWRDLAPLPHAAGMGGAAVWGDRIYVIGGVDDAGVTLNRVQEYDPATDTWKEKSPMPTPREHIGVAVIDSLIYVAAGRPTGLGGKSLPAFEAYSPASDTWYTLPGIPTLRSGLACAAANGKLYALGGEWPGVQSTNEEYDPVRKSWRQAKEMPVGRHGFTAIAYRNKIYVAGYTVAQVDVFTPPGYSGVRITDASRRPRAFRAAPLYNAIGVKAEEYRGYPVFPWTGSDSQSGPRLGGRE